MKITIQKKNQEGKFEDVVKSFQSNIEKEFIERMTRIFCDADVFNAQDEDVERTYNFIK